MCGVIMMDQPPRTPPKNSARIVREIDWSICRIRHSGTDALPPEGDSRGRGGMARDVEEMCRIRIKPGHFEG